MSTHALRVCRLYRQGLKNIRHYAVDHNLFIMQGTALQVLTRPPPAARPPAPHAGNPAWLVLTARGYIG